jgi:hypothetical protein
MAGSCDIGDKPPGSRKTETFLIKWKVNNFPKKCSLLPKVFMKKVALNGNRKLHTKI